MELGQQFSIWCVRISLLFFFGYVAFRLKRRQLKAFQRSRWCWTAATCFLLAHVVLALAFFHDFSHQQAYQHTAQRTWETTGLDWGGGIYFNYVFTFLCLSETLWMWFWASNFLRRPAWLNWAFYAFMLFMVINGAIVFAQGYVRWLSAGALLVLLLLLLIRLR